MGRMYVGNVIRAQAEEIKESLVKQFNLQQRTTGYSGQHKGDLYSVKIKTIDPKEDLNVRMNIIVNSELKLPIDRMLKEMGFKYSI